MSSSVRMLFINTIFVFLVLLFPHTPISHILKPFSNFSLSLIVIKNPNNLDDICASSCREDNPVFLKQRSYGSFMIWPKVP